MLVRVLAVWCWSPLDADASDSQRHFAEAMGLPFSFVSVLEPPAYSFWLGAFLKPSHAERFVVFLYSAAMTISMPVGWFLWMRAYFKNETLALTGFLIFAAMPSFIGIFSFFQPETLLLVIVGFTLWAQETFLIHPGLAKSIMVGLLWGLSAAVRVTIVPMAIVSLFWQSFKLEKILNRRQLKLYLVVQLACFVIVYSWVPIRHWQELGTIELLPGMVNFNKLLYESSNNSLNVQVKSKKGNDRFLFDSPHALKPVWGGFAPFPGWNSFREGRGEISVDFTAQSPSYPKISPSSSDRLRAWGENIFLFFFDSSWPENCRPGTLFCFETFLTRLWMPVFLSTTFLVLAYRVWTLPTIFFIVMSLVLIFQQTSIIEGRYRKPLECLTIVAMLDVIRLRFAKRKSELDDQQLKV